jgi:hypothetical protein
MPTGKVIREVFVHNTADTSFTHSLSTELFGGELIVVHAVYNSTSTAIDPDLTGTVGNHHWEEINPPNSWGPGNAYRGSTWTGNGHPFMNAEGQTWTIGTSSKAVFVYFICYGHDAFTAGTAGAWQPGSGNAMDYYLVSDPAAPFSVSSNTTNDAATDLFDFVSAFNTTYAGEIEHTTDSGYNDKGESVNTSSDFCNHHWVHDVKATTATASSSTFDTVPTAQAGEIHALRFSYDVGEMADYGRIGSLADNFVALHDYVEYPASTGSSNTFSLPDNIPADSLIVYAVGWEENANNCTVPSGFTRVSQGRNSSYQSQVDVGAKIADGTEGGTDITFACTLGSQSCATVYVFGNIYAHAGVVLDVIRGVSHGTSNDETPKFNDHASLVDVYNWQWDKHAHGFHWHWDGISTSDPTELLTTHGTVPTCWGRITPLRGTGTLAEEEFTRVFHRCGWTQSGQMSGPDRIAGWPVESSNSTTEGGHGVQFSIRGGNTAPVSTSFPGTTVGDGGHIWPPRANDPRWTQIIADSGITESGNFMDDVKAALIALSGASGGSLDDLWKRTLAVGGVTDTSEPYLY